MRLCSFIKHNFVIINFLIPLLIYSQENIPQLKGNSILLYQQVEQLYGLNQELANGIVYENYYRKALGYPFFQNDRFYAGNIVFRNTLYQDVEMKFDIYNEQIILKYDFNGKLLTIILPGEFITSFNMEGRQFKNYTSFGKDIDFYQVLGNENKIQCLYKWSKDRLDSYHLRTVMSYKFTDEIRKSFLLKNEKLYAFKGRHSFLKIFPKKNRDKIKNYMKSNGLRFKDCSDDKMIKLLDFCYETSNTLF